METEIRTTQAKEPEKLAKKLIFIAHAANSAEAIKKALEAGADFVEIDVWKAITRKILTVEHQWVVGSLGFGAELKNVLTNELIRANGRLYFDFKFGGIKGAYDLIEFLRQHGLGKPTIASTDWQTLVKLNQQQGVKPHFTIARPPDLEKFFKEAERLNLIGEKGISIRHTLLTPKLIQHFCDRDFEIVAWTVDDRGRAQELEAMGVDGIVSNNLSLTDR